MRRMMITMAAAVAAAAYTSCVKETAGVDNGIAVTSASTECSSTRTSLSGNDADGYEVVWSVGDEFTLGGNVFSLTGGAGTSRGIFRGVVPADGVYTAFYPATYDGTAWPAEQTYGEGGITGSPMTASVSVEDGKAPETVSFTNVGGILRLTVKNPESVAVRLITVRATGLASPVVLDCGEDAVLSRDGVDFHIALPEGTFGDVTIAITASDGDICTKTLKSSAGLVIERSKITTATFTVFDQNPWDMSGGCEPVDLGLSVKWASYNIGADTERGVGSNFAWGETESKSRYGWTYEGEYKWGIDGKKPLYGMTKYTAGAVGGDGLKTLLPEDDPATVNWGPKWRSPTVDEINELIDNCEWEWGMNNGCTVTSRITGKSIFLPAAGYRYEGRIQYSGTYGCYWSSSVDETRVSQACYLRFSSDEIISSEGGRNCGLKVRAVTEY